MITIGFSCFYHDASAAVCQDGRIVAAVEEERFTRKKHDNRFPVRAIQYCLKAAGIGMEEADYLIFYENPLILCDRVLQTVREHPDPYNARKLSELFSRHMNIEAVCRRFFPILGRSDRLYTLRHHLSHAASAFFPSPFEKAAILTIDGVGEKETTTIGVGENNQIHILRNLTYPHSLGLFYSAFTRYCGFRVNSGEYKLMGLAAYGKPVYADTIRKHLIRICKDGSFQLNMDYFSFDYSPEMTNEKFHALFGRGPCALDGPYDAFCADLAASVQCITEEIVLKLAATAKSLTGCDRLVMAGGVAMNCSANGVLLKKNLFKDIWIQPAAGDNGGSLGAALYAYHVIAGKERQIGNGDSQEGSLLGPAWSDQEIAARLSMEQAVFHRYENEKDLLDRVCECLDKQQIVGRFSGRMEYGYRALGNRSILADPRVPGMQEIINRKIKRREAFRPFAPAVLAEDADRYFELDRPSEYMLFTVPVRENAGIPAVTHVNGTARVQTVSPSGNDCFYRLLRAFRERTGCSVLLNTSFNVRGEPIVCSPEDTYRCFLNTDIDVLMIGSFLLYRNEQPEENIRKYREIHHGTD